MSNGLNCFPKVLLPLILVLFACTKDPEFVIDATDGIYIRGEATAFNYFDKNGLMRSAINTYTQQKREGLSEIYIAVSDQSEGFNIVRVIDGAARVMGPVSGEKIVLQGENGQIHGTIEKGNFGQDAGVFTVEESGLYHVIIDKQTETYVISHVKEFSLIGDTTEDYWIDNVMLMAGGFDKSHIIFEIEEIELSGGEFRFRYGKGDHLTIVENEVMVNTCFGGGIWHELPQLRLIMIPGENNYVLHEDQMARYSVEVIWTPENGFDGYLSEIKSGYGDYFKKLYMTGDGIVQHAHDSMIPVYRKPHLFWKIVWLNDYGGLRFSPHKGGSDDFGKAEELSEGLFKFGETDVPVPGKEGYYMVVVNLQEEKISISSPEVYMIGDAIDSWDPLNPDALFRVDNHYYKAILLDLYMKEGEFRIYAWHDKGWFTHWWDAEFRVDVCIDCFETEGKIMFRGDGPNLERISWPELDYRINMDFRTDSVSVQYCACCLL